MCDWVMWVIRMLAEYVIDVEFDEDPCELDDRLE